MIFQFTSSIFILFYKEIEIFEIMMNLSENSSVITLKDVKRILKKRSEDSHKGTFGHALLFAGSKGKMGAAVISSKACLRSGVGLLTVNIPEEERSILQTSLPEAMLQFREVENLDLSVFSAIAIGPAFGIDEVSVQLFRKIILPVNQPIVFDADALTILSSEKDSLNQLPANSILTPHPKEFDRLFGEHFSLEERQEKALQKAKELKCIIVLKGNKTFITNGVESFINETGNSGLAKGGSGDALTGIIVSLLAQKYSTFDAAKLGVYIHGLAADLTLKNQSEESMLISDVIENLGFAFKEIRY
jgi:NAD(P)H-hydrate epimerase